MEDMPVGPVTPRKDQVIDVVLVALGSSHEGLKALRDVLLADPRFSVLDGVVDLDPVWQILEAQPDFARDATQSAMCYVKGLEPRLGAQIRMPAALASMSPAERALHASRCPARREEIDRVLGAGDATRTTGAAPRLTSAPAPGEPPRLSRRNLIGIIAGVVAVASIVFTVYSVVSSLDGTPEFKTIDASEFAGDIPIGSARVWAGEVRAALVDPSWMGQPEERRRRQLESALQRLAPRNVRTLILEDDSQRTRASAQVFGKNRRVQIRFF
jgi:hypothetical protein